MQDKRDQPQRKVLFFLCCALGELCNIRLFIGDRQGLPRRTEITKENKFLFQVSTCTAAKVQTFYLLALQLQG